MSEPLKALPSELIARLFSRLQAVYGNRMDSMWKDADPLEVRRVWGEELGKFTPADIRCGLDALPQSYTDWPPTLYQFADLCRDAQRRRVQAARAIEYRGDRQPMPEKVRAQLSAFLAKVKQ